MTLLLTFCVKPKPSRWWASRPNPSVPATKSPATCKLLLGEMCFASLREAASALAPKGVQIDLVDCFRQSEEIPAIAADAIAIGARFLWMQIGITNPEASRRAEAAGLLVVQDRCTKTEHRRLQAQRLAL